MIIKGKKYVVMGAWKDCGELTDLFNDGDIVIPIDVDEDDTVAICILAEKYNEAEADELVKRYYEWEDDVEDGIVTEIKQIVDVMGKFQLVLCEEE